jgi:ribosomal protein L14E/L6E/L27E
VFASAQAPARFDQALLVLGPDIVVELPEPRAKRRPFGHQVLPIRRAREEEEETLATAISAEGATEHIRWAAEQLATEGQLQQLTAAKQRTDQELLAVQKLLETERELWLAEVERLRQGIMSVRASAEEALVAEQEAARRLSSDLRGAHEAINAKEAQLELTRDVIDRATADREQVIAAASAEAKALRDELDRVRVEAGTLRSELAASRAEIDHARSDAAAARSAADATREENEFLLNRVTMIREALTEES